MNDTRGTAQPCRHDSGYADHSSSVATPSQALHKHLADLRLNASYSRATVHTSETEGILGTVGRDKGTKIGLRCCMHRQPHTADPPRLHCHGGVDREIYAAVTAMHMYRYVDEGAWRG
jgi:hypothetical protein